MKRLIAILLMLILPTQMTLAAVSVIGMAAVAAPAQGAGDCNHQADTADATAGDEQMADSSRAGHGNCGTCQFNCCSALPITAAFVPPFSAKQTPTSPLQTQAPTPPAARPERPNWADLA